MEAGPLLMSLMNACSSTLALCLLLCGGGALAQAGSPSPQPGSAEERERKRAEAELEHELRETVHLPPPTIEIRFDGVDGDHYELTDSHVEVDGSPVPTQIPNGAQPAGSSRVLYLGVVSEGAHRVTAGFTLKQVKQVTQLFGYVDGYRFKLPGRYVLNAQQGLVLSLHLKVKVDEKTGDVGKRLALSGSVAPQMVAQLDDGSMPAPLAAPALVVPAKVTKRHRASVKVVLASAKLGAPEKPFTRMHTGRWKLRHGPPQPEVSPRALQAALEEARKNKPVESLSQAP